MNKHKPSESIAPVFTELTEHLCPNCLSKAMRVFHELDNVPVNSVLNIPTRENAISFPKGNILLGFCNACGFISNMQFDPNFLEYSSNCEESQGFSSTFNAFARAEANRLIETYGLRDKDIIEIGCGKGEFLTLMCDLGGNRCVGFDPAYVEGRGKIEKKGQTVFIKDYYSEKYAHYQGDFVCCRMTLEHIQDTAAFVGLVRRSIGDKKETIVFFQIPDVTRILRDCAFEDIYYEHCSYFSPGSLARLFRNNGFDILDLRTGYEDQYLMIEAKPSASTSKIAPQLLAAENDYEVIKGYVRDFPKKFKDITASWRDRLKAIREHGKRAVVWGSGSKGVSFLTTLKVRDEIEYVVDINPYRQGNFMAGTGHPIVSPEFLKDYRPDIVIIMNPIYRDEIKRDLIRMEMMPEILSL